jgi:MoxR-like ATPase
VIPDDIKYLVAPILAHRLMIKPESELRGKTTKSIIKEIVESTQLELGKENR